MLAVANHIAASYAVLAAYFIVQVFCARYLQRLLMPARTRLGNALQLSIVFVVCLFLSASGAIACEAFGYAFFLRVARSGR